MLFVRRYRFCGKKVSWNATSSYISQPKDYVSVPVQNRGYVQSPDSIKAGQANFNFLKYNRSCYIEDPSISICDIGAFHSREKNTQPLERDLLLLYYFWGKYRKFIIIIQKERFLTGIEENAFRPKVLHQIPRLRLILIKWSTIPGMCTYYIERSYYGTKETIENYSSLKQIKKFVSSDISAPWKPTNVLSYL